MTGSMNILIAKTLKKQYTSQNLSPNEQKRESTFFNAISDRCCKLYVAGGVGLNFKYSNLFTMLFGSLYESSTVFKFDCKKALAVKFTTSDSKINKNLDLHSKTVDGEIFILVALISNDAVLGFVFMIFLFIAAIGQPERLR